MRLMDMEFYKNKRVLITGHTGFKGSWLSIMLIKFGAIVCGYSLEPYSNDDNFVITGLKDKMQSEIGDIRDRDSLNKLIHEFKPEYIFHLAAQAIVSRGYEEAYLTYDTNIMGTVSLMEALKSYDRPCKLVVITTDKCYENKEMYNGYREDDRLGGYDPYSSSKACVELIVSSYRNSFFNRSEYSKHNKLIVSARAGNVIGGGDWSYNRLIPDCIRAIRNKEAIVIREPKAIRPWQHVIDPLYGYLLLGKSLELNSYDSYNFGPKIESQISVSEMVERLAKYFNYDNIIVSTNSNFHESKILNLDISRAYHNLGYKPVLNIDEALQYTLYWYENYKIIDPYNIAIEQIEDFLKK